MIDIRKAGLRELAGAICYATGTERRKPNARHFSKRELVSILTWVSINKNAARDLASQRAPKKNNARK